MVYIIQIYYNELSVINSNYISKAIIIHLSNIKLILYSIDSNKFEL